MHTILGVRGRVAAGFPIGSGHATNPGAAGRDEALGVVDLSTGPS